MESSNLDSPQPDLHVARRAVWPWSAAGAAVGVVIALAVLGMGASGGEATEGMIYLTIVGTLPCSWLTLTISAHTPWAFVLSSWCLQGLLIGSAIGVATRSFRWSRDVAWLALLGGEVLVPCLLVLFTRGWWS